jgi:glyoxylase-like metal-dependent hydrolase (beta-lactamase superfamily II)
MTQAIRLEPIRTPIANMYLLMGERLVLVDTGAPGNADSIVQRLEQQGFKPRDLALILLTHAHWDHLGSAAELRARTDAPIMLHRADLSMAQAGQQTIQPTGLDGVLMRPMFPSRFPALEPDVILDDETTLEAYGLDAHVIETPGHTAGSVSVLLPNGDAIVADVLRGAWAWPERPARHLFADDVPGVISSLHKLSRLPLRRVYTGHGQAFSGAALRQFVTERYPIQAAQEV